MVKYTISCFLLRERKNRTKRKRGLMSENKIKIKIAAVTGPTASGKTALAIALAQELNG